jgi:cytochrome c5
MLSQVLQALRNAPQPLCADTIAQIVDKEPGVVAAMLDELVFMGRVRVDSVQSACESCHAKSLCGLPMPSDSTYSLPEERG